MRRADIILAELDLRFIDVFTIDFDKKILQYHIDNNIPLSKGSEATYSLCRPILAIGMGKPHANTEVIKCICRGIENSKGVVTTRVTYINEDVEQMIKDIYGK